jgi:Protein of unknown function (DUF4242)
VTDDCGGRRAFLVEHYWPGITAESFEAACERVRRSADEIAGAGVSIRFVHSTLISEEETAFCLFAAESAAVVEDAYTRAAVPFDRVVDAMQIGVVIGNDEKEGR